MQALGGAKNHMVVMPDADTENAASALIGAAYGSAGERCMAISVAVAVGDAADPLIDALQRQLKQLKVGSGLDDGVEMGPLVTREHRDRVSGYVDLGVQEGAKLVVDGRGLRVARVSRTGFSSGRACSTASSRRCGSTRKRFSGRYCASYAYRTWPRRTSLVNAHEFGNGTAIFTASGEAARTFTQGVQAGMVGINVPIPVPDGFSLLRRLEALAVRGAARARPGRRALLHAAQDRDVALAYRAPGKCAIRHANDEVTVNFAYLTRGRSSAG